MELGIFVSVQIPPLPYSFIYSSVSIIPLTYFSIFDSMLQIQVPSSSIKYIVPKGFVCVDGTSLTICEVNAEANWFTFMLVAHTQQNVIIPQKNISKVFYCPLSNFFIFYSYFFLSLLFCYKSSHQLIFLSITDICLQSLVFRGYRVLKYFWIFLVIFILFPSHDYHWKYEIHQNARNITDFLEMLDFDTSIDFLCFVYTFSSLPIFVLILSYYILFINFISFC